MTVEQVSYLYGIGKTTVYKVQSGHTEGLSERTVNEIRFLLNIEVDYIKATFMRADFADMVSLVLTKGTKRHNKRINEIIRLADKCLRRHNTLRKDFVVKHITDDDFVKGEIMGIYYGDAVDLIKDELFMPLCDVATELAVKDSSLRSFICFAHSMSEMFINLDRKKRKDNEPNAMS